MVITTLGPEGTYASQATRKIFPEVEVRFCSTISDVLRAKGIRVVPLENSTEGTVRESFDGILEGGLFLSAVVSLPIVHSIGTNAKDFKKIKTVLSHPQAISQCQKFINKNLKTAKIILVNSTADAVKTAKENSSFAAIASDYACEIYGLPVAKKRIEDEKGNTTLFGVVADKDLFPASKFSDVKKDEMHIVVTPRKNKAGVLFNILKPFHDFDIDLTRLESRPTRKELGEYRFFMSFKIGSEKSRTTDAEIEKALKILKKNSKVSILGTTFNLK